MPYYEYRCPSCGRLTGTLTQISEKPASLPCQYGCDTQAKPIISTPNVKLSNLSKVERMDPKYDKMVDKAMNQDPKSDPMRYINRRGDPAKGRPD